MAVLFEFFKILLAIYFIYLFLYYVKNWKLYYFARRIKGPPVFPIIGSAYVLFGGTSKLINIFLKMQKEYGNLYKLWVGNELHIVISEPEILQNILNKSLEKMPSYKYLIPTFGNGLITLPEEQWRNHRKLMSTAFNKKYLNNFVKTFSFYSKIFTEKLENYTENKFFDVLPILLHFTADVICETVMGIKLEIMKNNGHNLISVNSKLLEMCTLPMSNPFLKNNLIWNLLSYPKEIQDLKEKTRSFIKRVVDKKKREMLKNEQNVDKFVILEYMFNLENKNYFWNEDMTVEEIQTIFVAGTDATTFTISTVLVMLGMHQEIQEKVYAEVHSFFNNNSKTENDFKDLSKLNYLERVIKETLRLFPVAGVIGRYLTNDIILDNHILPKGSSVFIPLICLHRDAEIWPEPEKFDPDRFLPSEVAKRPSYSYLPFSGGVRNCLGSCYAMMLIKTILATILNNYKVVKTKYESISEIELKLEVAIKFIHGHEIIIEKRS